MTHLNTVKEIGRKMLEDKFSRSTIQIIDIIEFINNHERVIEIALLQDLVEEAKGEISDHKCKQREGICECEIYDSALTNLITKYQDRINKLKA